MPCGGKKMLLPFKCDHCQRDKWDIIYNSETKGHHIRCGNCGKEYVLEDVFGKKKQLVTKKIQKVILTNTSIPKSTPTSEGSP
jgi:DNA-directed RNA polymerase subunit RPC12/RpoP